MAVLTNSQYHAIVDMGSNGIRFSISDLDGPTGRLLPTIYQSRSSISIYDAQFSGTSGQRVPIPQATIEEIISTLKTFIRTCTAYRVPPQNIQVLATEATRVAPNSDDFRKQVEHETGLQIKLLSKEDEGRIGAQGIASSFPAPLRGVILDLGGGSVQISWAEMSIEGTADNAMGVLNRSKTAVSMPFGAAAMIQRLESVSNRELSKEIEMAFRAAIHELEIPEHMLEDGGEGLTLYLSGGGFRGWGYALMDRHKVKPYPIPIINGFSVDAQDFHPDKVLGKDNSHPVTDETFRISSRRASQAPAVALLITSLLTALPKVSKIYFAQGGVREGSLWSLLPPELHGKHPLVAATSVYHQTVPGAEILAHNIEAAIPLEPNDNPLPPFLREQYSRRSFLTALTSLLNYHGSCPKDIRPSAALRTSTTGILASTHGLTHECRAWLGLALMARWNAAREDLPQTDVQFYDGLADLLGPEQAWWAGYVGVVAAVVGAMYPAGISEGGEQTRIWLREAQWSPMGKKGKIGLALSVDPESVRNDENVRAACEEVVKWGKKKRWEGRRVKGWKIQIHGLGEEDEDDE